LNSSVFVPAFYTLNKLVPETFLNMIMRRKLAI